MPKTRLYIITIQMIRCDVSSGNEGVENMDVDDPVLSYGRGHHDRVFTS